MPLTAAECDALAGAFHTAWQSGTFVQPPTRTHPGFSVTDAWAVARRVAALRVDGGAVVAGYKVGFTNAAVRRQFGAPGPMFAPVYQDTLRTPEGIVADAFLGPRIEPEIVVGIGADGDAAWAAFGFEIVQSHVADWKFAYLDTIADLGLHAALVIGERRALKTVDLERLGGIEVELRNRCDVAERGRGDDVDGGALGSLEWVRAALARDGSRLRPGDVVSTGSLTRVPPIAAGDTWTISARGGELPELSIRVA